MVKDILQFNVYLIGLNPTKGAEMNKLRPCVVVSPNEMNRYIQTVIIAPLTSTLRDYPTRIDIFFQKKHGQIALDQIRTVDKSRLKKYVGKIEEEEAKNVSKILVEMFEYHS